VIALRADLKVVMAAHPVDFRKSVHTLSALVSEALRANPYCGDVFVFRSKRADRVKLLAWDGSGMVLVTKWLHQGGFTWPPIRDGVVQVRLAGRPVFEVDRCQVQAGGVPHFISAIALGDAPRSHEAARLGWSRFANRYFLRALHRDGHCFSNSGAALSR
jgi:transposase